MRTLSRAARFVTTTIPAGAREHGVQNPWTALTGEAS